MIMICMIIGVSSSQLIIAIAIFIVIVAVELIRSSRVYKVYRHWRHAHEVRQVTPQLANPLRHPIAICRTKTIS